MGGEDPLLRCQRPNVHVVDFEHAVDRDFAFDLFIIELARFSFHDEPDQIARNRERRRQRDDREHKRTNGVDDFVLGVDVDNDGGDENTNALRLVRKH